MGPAEPGSVELAPSTGVHLFIRLPGVRVCGADATKDGPERQCPGNPGEGINAELDQHWRPVQHADQGHGNDNVDRKADTEDDQGQHPSLPMGDFHHPAPRAGKTGRPGRVSHVTACLQDAWLQPMCRVRAESPAFGTWHDTCQKTARNDSPGLGPDRRWRALRSCPGDMLPETSRRRGGRQKCLRVGTPPGLPAGGAMLQSGRSGRRCRPGRGMSK